MNQRVSMRCLPKGDGFEKGDVFVLFGELFERGYATGLLEEARKAGMQIIGITVGRRTENNRLRPLNSEELDAAEAHLGGKIVNIPLMAGFDLDSPEGQPTPRDIMSQLQLDTWRDHKFDWEYLELCRALGVQRFKESSARAFAQISAMIPDGRNVHFAHTMAGGVPKTKIFLALANRIYKGRGNRFLSSDDLLASDLGKLVLQNFEEVTANTFQYLVDGTESIRERVKTNGKCVSYSAYGYHGTEILIGQRYQWQSYANYTQGYAKLKLEQIATAAWERGINAVVFNCPEIRTNSSDIFVGVELPLFSFLLALKKENGGERADTQWQTCRSLLDNQVTLEEVLQRVQDLNDSKIMDKNRNFEAWPMANDPDLADLVIGASEEITQMHKDGGVLITDKLSWLVVKAAGTLIFREVANPLGPVIWLNHDIIAKQVNNDTPLSEELSSA